MKLASEHHGHFNTPERNNLTCPVRGRAILAYRDCGDDAIFLLSGGDVLALEVREYDGCPVIKDVSSFAELSDMHMYLIKELADELKKNGVTFLVDDVDKEEARRSLRDQQNKLADWLRYRFEMESSVEFLPYVFYDVVAKGIDKMGFEKLKEFLLANIDVGLSGGIDAMLELYKET